MNPICKTEIKRCLINHKADIVARLRVNNKIATAVISIGERHSYEALHATKFRMLVDFYQSLGFANKTALRLARYGCGKNSTNTDTHYYVVDGQLVGCTDYNPQR